MPLTSFSQSTHRPLLLAVFLSAATLSAAQAQAPTAAHKPAATSKATAPRSATTAPAPVLAPTGGIKPEDRASDMTTKMTQALGLSPEQVKRVQQINLLSVKRVEEAKQTYIKQLPRMRQEIDLIGQSRLSLLKDVLTEAQFRAYAAMREKKMGIPEALKKQADAAGGMSGDQ